MRGLGARLVLAAALLAGCASSRPVLYPDASDPGAQRDIEECLERADAADLDELRAAKTAKSTATGAGVGAAVGAAVGAVTGNPGRGAAAGAAGGGVTGFFRGLFRSDKPDPVYRRYVEICLGDRGHRTIGWK